MGKRKNKRDQRRDRRHQLKAGLNMIQDDVEDSQKMQSRHRSHYVPKERYLKKDSKLEIAELLTKCPPVEDVVVEDPLPPFSPVFCVNLKNAYTEICLN